MQLPKHYLKDRFKTGKKPTQEDFGFLIDGVPRYRETFIATENQKVFTLSQRYTIQKNQIEVVVGGIPQFSPVNYEETSATTLTFYEGLPAGIEVVVTYYE